MTQDYTHTYETVCENSSFLQRSTNSLKTAFAILFSALAMLRIHADR